MDAKTNKILMRQSASFVYTAGKEPVSPLLREIQNILNQIEEAKATGEVEQVEFLAQVLFEQLDELDATNAAGHPNPPWICRVMRALGLSRLDRLAESIALEKEAQNYARADEDGRQTQLARNKINLAIRYRRGLGEYVLALEYAMAACELWPENDGIMIDLAICLFKAGKVTAARQVIARLAKLLPDVNDPKSVLAASLRFDDEFKEMKVLPEVSQLYDKILES